jgi:uncharacterized protein YutE (UPF0331/DUF86 family)
MTKEELQKYCDKEFQNVKRLREEIFSLFTPEKSEYTISEKAALYAFVTNIYRGLENILKRILIFDQLDVKDSPEWHEKILKKAAEMGILTPELFQIFSQYLSFRNHFLYTDIFNIKWDDLKVLIGTIPDVVDKFKAEVHEYLQTI